MNKPVDKRAIQTDIKEADSANRRRMTYDQTLILVTAISLFLTGVVMIWGTLVHFVNTANEPNWSGGPLFSAYTSSMNSAVMPFVLATVLALGLCIPRRMFKDRLLIALTSLMVGASAVVSVLFSTRTGLAVFMGAAILLQTIVLAVHLLTKLELNFLKKKRIVRLGSLLAHLGLMIFVVDIVMIQDTLTHVRIFWIACTLILVGTFLMFYPDTISRSRPRR